MHLKKLRARDEVSAAEERAIRDAVSQVVDVPADKTLVFAGQELRESIILLQGWMARAKDLRTGHRQITELHVAGDFTDLHGFTLKRLDHDVVTISRCRIARIPHVNIQELTQRFPHLMRVRWFGTNMDAAIHREWTLSLGRRTALGRMAHLFCELLVRLRLVGLAPENAFDFPLTQVELGECLGLTAVHVNRTLQELRRMELIELQAQRLSILDLAGLRSAAEFDEDYLYLEKRER